MDQQIPAHIWEMIFNYSGNLVSLTATCKTFQEIIEANTPLMSKITCHFVQGPILCDPTIYTRRKYQKMECIIPQDFSEQVLEILSLQKGSLRALKIVCLKYPLLFPYFGLPAFHREILDRYTYHGDYFGSQTNKKLVRVVDFEKLKELVVVGDLKYRFQPQIRTQAKMKVVASDWHDFLGRLGG